MFHMPKLSRWFLLLLIGLMACWPVVASGQQPLVVFLVRHAEKVDSSPDAKLSTLGKARAEALATLLRDAEIKHVHSTDFIRTRDTAAPVAKKCGVDISLYPPGGLAALAENLKSQGGRHLVVGHSNTTPRMVELLGGAPGARITEQEYDRLYILTVGADGAASTVVIRFGASLPDDAGD